MDIGKVVFANGGPTRGHLDAGPKPYITSVSYGGSLPRCLPVTAEMFSDAFGGFPYDRPIAHDKALESDEINRTYQTKRITVDKRTHRIRYENETEHEVTIVIKPK